MNKINCQLDFTIKQSGYGVWTLTAVIYVEEENETIKLSKLIYADKYDELIDFKYDNPKSNEITEFIHKKLYPELEDDIKVEFGENNIFREYINSEIEFTY